MFDLSEGFFFFFFFFFFFCFFVFFLFFCFFFVFVFVFNFVFILFILLFVLGKKNNLTLFFFPFLAFLSTSRAELSPLPETNDFVSHPGELKRKKESFRLEIWES